MLNSDSRFSLFKNKLEFSLALSFIGAIFDEDEIVEVEFAILKVLFFYYNNIKKILRKKIKLFSKLFTLLLKL